MNDAVVRIEVVTDGPHTGTGVLVGNHGRAVTAAHVVSGASQITVVTATGTRPAQVVAISEPDELALLQVEGAAPAGVSGSDRAATVGETIQVAAQQPVSGRVTETGARRRMNSSTGAKELSGLLITDASTVPGTSGAAVLDARGEIVGIVVGGTPPEAGGKTETSAVPWSRVQSVFGAQLGG